MPAPAPLPTTARGEGAITLTPTLALTIRADGPDTTVITAVDETGATRAVLARVPTREPEVVAAALTASVATARALWPAAG